MQPDTVALSWAQPSLFPSARFKLTHKSTSDTVLLDDTSVTTTHKTDSTKIPQSETLELYVESLGGEGTPSFTTEVSLANGFSCSDKPDGTYSGESVWYTYNCPALYPSSPWQPTVAVLVYWDTTEPFNPQFKYLTGSRGGVYHKLPFARLLEYVLLGIRNEGTAPIEPVNGYLFGNIILLENSHGDYLELSAIPCHNSSNS